MKRSRISFPFIPGMVIPFAGAIDPNTYALASGQIGTINFAPDVRNNSGWILCDGSNIQVAVFPELVRVLGDQYGGDLSQGLAQVPDYRGWFHRGQSMETFLGAELPEAVKHAGEDRITPTGELASADSETGSRQTGMVQAHMHKTLGKAPVLVSSDSPVTPVLNDQSAFTQSEIFSPGGNPESGSETRPVNAYVHYLIFAGDR